MKESKKAKPKKTQSKTIKEIQGKSKDIQCNIVAKQRIQTKKSGKKLLQDTETQRTTKNQPTKRNNRTNIET